MYKNNMNLYPESDVRNAISVALCAKLYDPYELEIEHDSFNHTVDHGIMNNFKIVEVDGENFIDIGEQDLDAFVEEATDFDIEDNSIFEAAVIQKYNVSEELYRGHELLTGHVASFLESTVNGNVKIITITNDDPRYIFYVSIGKDIAMISSNYHKSKDHLVSAMEGYIYALENEIPQKDLLVIAKKLDNATALDFAVAIVKENQKMEALS